MSVLLSSALGIIPTILQNRSNEKIANKNIALQGMTNEHNYQVMKEQWAREDNAVQRRVADLKAAGLSPLLAAGDAAGAGQVVQATAPQDTHRAEKLDILNALQVTKALKQADANIGLTNAQTYKAMKDAELVQKNIDHYGESPELKNIEYIWSKLEEYLPDFFSVFKGFGNGSDPASDFGVDVPPSPTPEAPKVSQVTKDAVDKGYGSYSSNNKDGTLEFHFNSVDDARKWYLSIGGTTYEWYTGIRKYGSPEAFLRNLLQTGGFYFD